MSMWWPPLPKMGLSGFIIALQIIRVCSASRIVVQNDNGHLKTAVDNIVDQCFGSSKSRSELLIVLDQDSRGILENVHHRSKTSNLIVFLNPEETGNGLTHPRQYNSSFNASFEWKGFETTAIMITIHSVKHLEYVLRFLKNNTTRLWRPGVYILFVLDNRCDVAECNNMFKVIWDYWILNAVILSSSNKPGNRNRSDIELYNFNPYSGDHPQQWETIVHETVEVTISQGKFNHSWHIFKQTFTEIKSSDDCGDIFFDKTSNLDGYVIPISIAESFFFATEPKTAEERRMAAESPMVKTVSKLLRFEFVEVPNNDSDLYGQLGLVTGIYTGVMKDIYTGRSHIAVYTNPTLGQPFGFEMTYPHDRSGACLASRIVGNRPAWTNFAVAKQIFIALGCGLLFSTVIVYVHNKPQGIVSALLDAERLIIGSSLVNKSVGFKYRTLIGSMFLVVLVIDGAIKGRFISILTVVRPYPNIDTIEQVVEHGMDIVGPETFEALVLDSKYRVEFHNSMYLEPCIDVLEHGERNQVCIHECGYMMYFAVNLSITYKSSTPLTTIPETYFTTQYWPMKNRYSREVHKIVESGIFQKWESDSARDVEFAQWEQSRTLEQPPLNATKLNDLLPAFLLLLVGLSSALIVFACEMKRWKFFGCVKF